ncbi:MAG TPA: OmpA family protein, partial [Tardiphaga sp.]
MIKLRLVLLATTTLTAMQFASHTSHAQTAPLVVAQAKDEVGPDGRPKAPPKAAPPPARPAPPAAAPPHPAPPPA